MSQDPGMNAATVTPANTDPYFKLVVSIETTSKKELLEVLLNIYGMYNQTSNEPLNPSHETDTHRWAATYEEVK